MGPLLALFRSLGWKLSVAFLLFWNAMFLLVKLLGNDCPPEDELCHPLSKVLFYGTLIISGTFFGAITFSEKFRNVALSPERRRFYNREAFFTLAVISLGMAAIFAVSD